MINLNIKQKTLLKSGILRENMFNIKYRISADYNQFLSISNSGATFSHFPVTIAEVSVGGISYSNIRTTIEKLRIHYSFFGISIKIIYFIQLLAVDVIRIVLGNRVTGLIRKYKWLYTKNI